MRFLENRLLNFLTCLIKVFLFSGQTLPLEQKDSGMQRNRTLSSNPAVFSGRQIHPKVEEDAALFVHDYPSSVESVVEVESSLNNSMCRVSYIDEPNMVIE